MAELTPPYENQLIGAFLLGLGYYGGSNRFPHPIRANLYQQGPLDAQFGDLLIGAASFVMIEFKRFGSRDDVKAEIEKWDVPALKDWLNEDLARWKMAQRCHVLAYSQPKSQGETCWRSYMHTVTGKPFAVAGDPTVILTADNLIQELYSPTILGAPPDQVLGYLNSVRKFRKVTQRKSATGGGKSSSKEAAFLGIALDHDKKMRFVVEDSMAMILEYQLRRDRELRQQQEQDREHEHEHEHSRDYDGPSL